MVTVYIGAGLANRMFQYAFALYLKHNGLDVDINEHSFKPRYNFEDTKLSNVFSNITLNESFNSDLRSALKDGYIIRGLRKISEFFPDYRYIQRWSLNCYPDIYKESSKHCKYVGYWISYKYFEGIENIIRNAFTFKSFSNPQNAKIAKEIQSTNSIAVHFRKNIDYLKNNPNSCPATYFLKAIEVIKNKIEEPKFYFFSDNWDWVRNNIHGIDYTPVDWNSPNGNNSYCDMQLMSLCKHNIISNSTYSWWGAWLNNNSDKIVLCPSYWFPHLKDIKTLIPPTWQIVQEVNANK